MKQIIVQYHVTMGDRVIVTEFTTIETEPEMQKFTNFMKELHDMKNAELRKK